MMKSAVKAVPMMPMKLMMRKWRKEGIMEKLKVRMPPHIKAHTLCQIMAQPVSMCCI